jgi:glucokinase
LLAIGIDIGGTKILGAVVDATGNILSSKKIPSPARDPEKMISVVAELIAELAKGAPEAILGVGVAAAGFIDAEQSTILYAPNLNWRNEPLRDRLQAVVPFRIVIENDANAAGWAEYKFGAGRGSKDMVMLTLGTGVGGAVISDHKLRRGGFGIGGELGHIRVVQNGLQCGCGRKGCVEQYSSGSAVVREANALVAAGSPLASRLSELSEANSGLTGMLVYQALLEADPGAISLANQAGGYLGQAMGSISAALDPQIYVIGGGLSEAGELILAPIREGFLKELPARGFRPEALVVAATFSNQAGVIGAADLARESLG